MNNQFDPNNQGYPNSNGAQPNNSGAWNDQLEAVTNYNDNCGSGDVSLQYIKPNTNTKGQFDSSDTPPYNPEADSSQYPHINGLLGNNQPTSNSTPNDNQSQFNQFQTFQTSKVTKCHKFSCGAWTGLGFIWSFIKYATLTIAAILLCGGALISLFTGTSIAGFLTMIVGSFAAGFIGALGLTLGAICVLPVIVIASGAYTYFVGDEKCSHVSKINENANYQNNENVNDSYNGNVNYQNNF